MELRVKASVGGPLDGICPQEHQKWADKQKTSPPNGNGALEIVPGLDWAGFRPGLS